MGTLESGNLLVYPKGNWKEDWLGPACQLRLKRPWLLLAVNLRFV